MIKRILEKKIKDRFFKGKAILLIGARQVGKTSLVKKIQQEYIDNSIYLNADESDVRDIFDDLNLTILKKVIGDNKLLIIDEAQRIEQIGLAIKLLVDNLPEIQVIVTGSSSFELKNKLNEPLTGRKYLFHLYPISFSEMVDHTNLLEEKRLLEHRMIYGYYPEIVVKNEEEKELLELLSESYLYKDIASIGIVKKTEKLRKLLQALALQVGNEVSYNELSQLVGLDNETVEKYIEVLEKSFVIFRLASFSRNIRNELKKGKKIYFYDNGILNSIIHNFNQIDLRRDKGALWENFLLSERIKKNEYSGKKVNMYFWRTQNKQEIDYIEEYNGKLHAYEFKYNENKKAKPPQSFMNKYKDSEFKVINSKNYLEFI